MKWPWSHFKLKGKFRLLLLSGLLIWLSNFSIIYFEIHDINQATLNLESREELYNTVLEIRRYEKNFLLYHGRANLDETIDQFNKAGRIFKQISKNAGLAQDTKRLLSLNATLKDYGLLIDLLMKSPPDRVPGKAIQERIRTVGKRMVDLSDAILTEDKHQVAVAAHRALRWPVISMGLILILFFLGAIMISRKVVQPLVSLEKATEEIGRGNFGPLRHPVRIESEVDRLILAFNRMAEELETRQEQIIHSRKIASLGTLVSGVAHELNNPINNIILTIDSLTGGRKITEDRRQELLNDILTQAERASGIVKNLLDFSRSETSVIEDLDIGLLLKETIRVSENQMAVNKIKLIGKIDTGLPVIKGNRHALQQVLINLLTNAVQAMPSGGELKVGAAMSDERRVVITVSDTGKGISEKHLPNIFDPFFTTKEVGKGTGLGLSVSYGIVKKHGGRITVESAPGKGSTFSIVLPAGGEVLGG
jgi:two-component system, NtrC family, sensor kinase